MSICEMVKTLKLSVRQEREAMSICEMVKTLKWYYLHNMREIGREKAMSICEMVKTLKQYYLHNMREREGYVHM